MANKLKAVVAAALAVLLLGLGAIASEIANEDPAAPEEVTLQADKAASSFCNQFTVAGPVKDITTAFNGARDYLVTSNGYVYAPCSPYFGGAGGQSYFNGKTVDRIMLCVGNTAYGSDIIGYGIINTQNQGYWYGNTAACTSWVDN